MTLYSIKASAKVNLALDVLGKSDSGYHLIQTVLHEVPHPFDEIIFEKSSTGSVSFGCSNPLLAFDEKNTIVQAISLFERKFSKKVSGHFAVTKNISLRAGLGGGSSDAAATLKLLRRAYEVECCRVDSCHEAACPLFEIARAIGMDVAFFINGGTQLATHFGEVLMPLPSVSPYFNFEVINTGVEISTAAAYEALNLSHCGRNQHLTQQFLEALQRGDVQRMHASLHNDFDLTTAGRSEKIMLAGSGGARVKLLVKV